MILTAAAAALLLLAHTSTATAQPGLLEFSRDGSTWTTAPSSPLFDRDVVLVPGGSATATLHLRSTAPTAGELSLALAEVTASDEWAAQSFALQIDVAVREGEGTLDGGLPRTRFSDLEEGSRLGSPVHLAPGEDVTLTVTIALDGHAAGNRSQNSAIDLDLRVGLTEALASGGSEPHEGASTGHGSKESTAQVIPVLGTGNSTGHVDQQATTGHGAEPSVVEGASTPSQGPGLLAVTGAAAQGMALAALAALLLGLVMLLISRRRREETR
jgi:LPXTG-motif cell wall-anchored protein